MAGEPGGGVKIESREDFEAWLDKRKPPKEICVVLAARAALRALPFAAMEIPEKGEEERARRFARLCAALFRAAALARIAAKYPTRANEFRAAYAADAALAAADAAARVAAAYAADAAADAAAATDAAAAAYAAAARAAAAAAAAYAADDASFWRALAADVSNVESGQSSRDLADAPLWPVWPPTVVADNWRALAAALPDSDGWRVWKQWYEARLDGEPWSEARELVFAAVPVEKWDEGPVAANAWIATHLIPSQNPIGSQFARRDDGVIDVVPDPPVSEPIGETDQRETYEEMQFLAGEIIALGPNVLGSLAEGANRLCVALQPDYANASIRKLYFAGNYMRESLDAHEAAKAERESAEKPDPFPSPAELPLAVLPPLRSFVKAYKIFSKGDATAQKLEALETGVDTRSQTRDALNDIAPVVDDVPPTIATEEARTTLSEQVEAGASAPNTDLGDKDRAVAKESTLNFVLEALRTGTGAAFKGAAGGAGKKIVEGHWTEISDFVQRNADEIMQFARRVMHDSDTLQRVLDAIRHLIS